MDFDKLAVVDATASFKESPINLAFCQAQALLVGQKIAPTHYMFYLSDEDVRYFRLIKDAKDAGCSDFVVNSMMQARKEGARYILFYI